MAQIHLREETHHFIHYKESQVGGALPVFWGSLVMYGWGIDSNFMKSNLFFFLSLFAIAKAHLKPAISNIASNVVKEALEKITNQQNQEVSVGIMVLSCRPRKRLPGNCVVTLFKKHKGVQ